MDTIEDIMGAKRALRTFSRKGISADTEEQLDNMVDSPSPVDAICRSVELLYARREELDDDGRTLVARLASFAAVNGWHGMADGNRGGLIAQAMNRETGGAALPGQPKPQAAKDDPAPVEDLANPAPTAEPVAAPVTADDAAKAD